MQCVENCDDPNRQVLYEQPVWQTLQMFLGEMLCESLIFLILPKCNHSITHRHKASCQSHLHGSEQIIDLLPSTFQTPRRKFLQSPQHSNSVVAEFCCCGFLPLVTSRVPPSVWLLFLRHSGSAETDARFVTVDEYRLTIHPGIDLSNDKRCFGLVRRRP
jgi:hypothetical protein